MSRITTAFHGLRLTLISVDCKIPIGLLLIKPISESVVSFPSGVGS